MNMSTKDKPGRVRKNFRIPADLAEWVDKFAQNKNTTMTQLIINYFLDLRRKGGSQ